MKKSILVLILLLVVISAVGCTESNNKNTTDISSESFSQSQTNLQQPSQIEYQDNEWAKNVTEITEEMNIDWD